MTAAKTFASGDRVEVRSQVVADWEPATYRRRIPEMGAWHGVDLDRSLRRDSMTGLMCDADNPRGVLSPFVCVPSSRIRRAADTGTLIPTSTRRRG